MFCTSLMGCEWVMHAENERTQIHKEEPTSYAEWCITLLILYIKLVECFVYNIDQIWMFILRVVNTNNYDFNIMQSKNGKVFSNS